MPQPLIIALHSFWFISRTYCSQNIIFLGFLECYHIWLITKDHFKNTGPHPLNAYIEYIHWIHTLDSIQLMIKYCKYFENLKRALCIQKYILADNSFSQLTPTKSVKNNNSRRHINLKISCINILSQIKPGFASLLLS